MMLRRGMAALLLAGAAAIALPAQAQVPGTKYEVRRGDTLFAIARKTRPENLSRNQMILAIWRANQSAFPGGNIHLLEVGTVLAIPARESVAAIDPADADREVRELLAARPTPAAQIALARPEAVAPAAPAQPPKGQEQAMRRYQEGLALELKGDDRGALAAFLEAGEGGYGLAQRKLGQIYDKGNSAVRRDLQTSIVWYQKARAQGVPIDKQAQRILPK